MCERVCIVHGVKAVEAGVTRSNRSGLVCSVTRHRLLVWNVVGEGGVVLGVGAIEDVTLMSTELERMARAFASYVEAPRCPCGKGIKRRHGTVYCSASCWKAYGAFPRRRRVVVARVEP